MNETFLLVNKLGGYSSTTVNYSCTSKYHGLLCAGINPDKRLNIVNRIEEKITLNGAEEYLSSNIYRNNVVFPEGYKNLQNYQFEYYPTWFFETPNVQIKKYVVIDKYSNKMIVKYEFNNNAIDTIAEFEIIPLFTFRDINELKRYDPKTDYFAVYSDTEVATIKFDLENFLAIKYIGWEFDLKQDIYYDFYYPDDDARGYDSVEDLQKIGAFNISIPPGKSSKSIEFSFNNRGNVSDESDNTFLKHALHEKNSLDHFYQSKAYKETELLNMCLSRANDFLLEKNGIYSIVAGYPWFGEWGRDTFISFKGLLLCTDKFFEAKNILLKWGKMLKNGLLPNLPGNGDYNSLDASLWYAVSVWEYYISTGSLKNLEQVVEVLEQIFLSFKKGSSGISIEKTGFLSDLNNQKALTWMDAKINGFPVIDRSGNAVEIQALWYNFLCILDKLKIVVNDKTHLTDLKSIKKKIKLNFEKFFWNEKTNCLYDVIRDGNKDGSIRPNQIIVLYLPFNDLVGVRTAKRILMTVEQNLLTVAGLRTLAPSDKNYMLKYQGDETERNKSYHNGTVWTFLLGMYLIAYLKVNNKTKPAHDYVEKKLFEFEEFLKSKKLTFLPEILEAETLESKGCISQAWSTALILEAIIENN